MSSDPLDTLKARYKHFEFKNKTDIQQHIELADGDSVICMPRPASVRLQSDKFHQLPSISTFDFKQPSIKDLRELGMLKSGKEESAPSTTEDKKTPAPKNNPPSDKEDEK